MIIYNRHSIRFFVQLKSFNLKQLFILPELEVEFYFVNGQYLVIEDVLKEGRPVTKIGRILQNNLGL